MVARAGQMMAPMKRQLLRHAIRVALLILLAAITGTAYHELRARSDVTIVYVGAEDCTPCRAWHRAHWPGFAASREYQLVTFREVTSPRLFDLLEDRNWPQDLRGLRQRIDRSAGVPLWFIVVDGEPLMTVKGLREWQTAALPTIRLLVR